jgi:hypothetical protein
MPSPRDPTPRRPLRAGSKAVAPEGTRRSFTDTRGTVWTVHEEHTPPEEWSTADLESSQHGYGVGWLVFESADVRKRLRLYAANWHEVSDQELETLCRRARPFEEPPASG